MKEGAMGVGSSLIYPPAFFAKTNELVELCKEASKYNGMYISHIRNEGNKLFEAVDELMTISKEANIPSEIYHFKASGKDNWWKVDSLIKKIDRARAEGLRSPLICILIVQAQRVLLQHFRLRCKMEVLIAYGIACKELKFGKK
jgi:hypothetical protein